uniref:Uncharacterized protein n=1 Tax=Elizabethkingia anophelis TaxID=1117645 RepID=A0A455ZI48_9FLAO|nr:TPA_exp: hypothetical protein [Elizabethkingia anophelis]
MNGNNIAGELTLTKGEFLKLESIGSEVIKAPIALQFIFNDSSFVLISTLILIR